MNYYKGAAWFIISLIISSLNDVVAKYVSFNLPVWETVFFRFFFGTITLVPFILFYGKESIASSKPLVHLSRGIILTLAIYLWINGLNVTDVAVATIITFTMPIFVLILAATLLKEKVSIKLWVLSIIGLIGVVITLNPKGIEFNINSTYLIFAAGFFASLDIINKKYIIKESMLSMLFYSSLVTTIISMIPLIYNWKIPTFEDLFLLLILGSGSNAILFCLLKAYKIITVSSVAPLRYLELIFSIILGNIIFHEIPKNHLLLGAAIIIPSSFYIIRLYQNNDKQLRE
ncbi:MAG: DMT family transporter [Rickettsiales bacterium]|jgi:S-adenosylmethionine uptake transporter|nr:DMT family transporter [Rickettsiales bacterium]